MGPGPKAEWDDGLTAVRPEDVLTVDEICAYLVGRPWNVCPTRLAYVTAQQVQRLFFCERDEGGIPRSLDRGGQHERGSYEEMFRDTWAKRGASVEQQDQLWKAFIELEGRRGSKDEWIAIVDGVMKRATTG